MGDNEEHAEHLALISVDLRAAGDVELIRLTDESVGPHPYSLADELWLIASQLNWDAAMAVTVEHNERNARG